MDEYALQQELEALAGNAFNPDAQEKDQAPEPMGTTMARWQKLFSLSQDQAVDRIMEHRNNLTRPRISDAHWEMLSKEKEAQGYDREAYEYELDLQRKKAVLPDLVAPTQDGQDSMVTYLVELGGPLDSGGKVQVAAGLDVAPIVVSGISAETRRKVRLCCVDGVAKAAIVKWAMKEGGGYEPTILADPRSLR